jgi:uncharacterized protein YqeY
MSMRERLEAELKQAMKTRDAARLSCLRMLTSRIQEREVALRALKGRDYRISDEEALEVIAGYAKQRRDSIEGYAKGGRQDLVEAERAELEIVQEYLPKQLSASEVRGIVERAIAEAGAKGAGDIGAVMRIAMPQVKGVADGKLVQQIAREMLEAKP